MRLIMRTGNIKEFLLHFYMAVLASLDHLMLFDPVIDLLHRMTGKAVAAAIRHGAGVNAMTVDAGEHRFVAQIGQDIFFQCRMAGKTITGTGEKSRRQKNKDR